MRNNAWNYSLTRFDGEEGGTEGAPSAEQDPEGAEHLGDPGKKALDSMKEQLKTERQTRQAAEAALQKIKDDAEAQRKAAEDAKKSDEQKQAERIEQLEASARAAETRALKAEIRAQAGDFADLSDALLNIESAGELSRFVKDGDIDTDAIKAELDKLLETKPHLKKATPQDPQRGTPKPDPSQGSGRGGGEEKNYETASKDEVKAGLAAYGLRSRS